MTRELRKEVKLDGSIKETIILMAEGNPGGLTVMMEMIKANGLIEILHLDDMNMRGPQIWVGYKDYCDHDMEKFLKCITSRDKDMVDYINKEMALAEYSHVAVTAGGSTSGGRKFLTKNK